MAAVLAHDLGEDEGEARVLPDALGGELLDAELPQHVAAQPEGWLSTAGSSDARWQIVLANSSAGLASCRCEPGSSGKVSAATCSVAVPSCTASRSASPVDATERRICSTASKTRRLKKSSKKVFDCASTSSTRGAARPSAIASAVALLHGSAM